MTVAGRLSCLFGASAQPRTFRRSELPSNHLDSLSASTTNHQNYTILPSSSTSQNSHSFHIRNAIINSSVYSDPYPVRISETQPSGGFLFFVPCRHDCQLHQHRVPGGLKKDRGPEAHSTQVSTLSSFCLLDINNKTTNRQLS